jgi:hypothetical protein
MPLTDIMTALLTPLAAIPAIGHVYPYDRIALDPTALNGIMGPLSTLRFWCLSRAGTQEVWRGNGSVERLHRLRLRGYLALDDPHASERVYQDLLDEVLTTLSDVITVPGSAEYLTAPLLERQEARMLAETVPVHFSETFMVASEYMPVMPVSVLDGTIDDYRALGDWLTAQLATLPAIGQVHPYERLAVEPDLAPAVFGASPALRAWTLTRESVQNERNPGLESRGQERLVLRGYLSVDDPQASELVMQDLLEQIAALLRPSHTVGTFDRVGPLQIEQVTHAMMGQTHLCHFAQCALPVEAWALALRA